MNTEELIVNILKARNVGAYCLEFSFTDGITRVVDFRSFLGRSSHPGIRKYLNKELFSRFTIENGDLIWGDYDLCFPIADLYDGTI